MNRLILNYIRLSIKLCQIHNAQPTARKHHAFKPFLFYENTFRIHVVEQLHYKSSYLFFSVYSLL